MFDCQQYMRKASILFILISVVISAFSQTNYSKWFTIKGFLPQWNQALVELEIDGKVILSDTVQNDICSFTGIAPDVQQAVLKVKKGRATYFLPLFLEHGTIKIHDAGHNILHASGTFTNNKYYQLLRIYDSLALLLPKASFNQMRNHQRSLAAEYIKENPESIISLQLLKDYFFLEPAADDKLYNLLFNGLNIPLKTSYIGKKIASEVKTRYNIALGMPAPIVTLRDVDNNFVQLFEKGKLTMVIFWMSKCLPCKKENPELLGIYNKYKENNFTMVGVSLDTDWLLWKNSIKTEQLIWKQLSDLHGWESIIIKTYGVKVVPTNFLIDENGIIIAKNLNLNEMDHLIASLMSLKSF